jgi:hypothetical protein
MHGGITILTDNKKLYKAAALNPHLLSPKVGESCSAATVLQKCYPIPRVLGPAYTPLPARRNEAFQIHTNVIHGSSCSVPFTVSLLSVPFGEIALIRWESNRDFPNSWIWLLLRPVSSHIPQASIRKMCGSWCCTKIWRFRHQRSCVPTRAWTL